MKCINCGKETRNYSYRRKIIGGNKYCCEECHREYWKKHLKKEFKPKKCSVCGTEFIPKSNTHKYCSNACKYQTEIQKRSKKPKVKICKHCGNEFKPYSSLDKFCSATCRINYHKSQRIKNWTDDKCVGILGENNPAFRNGLYVRTAKKTNRGERLFRKNVAEIKKQIKKDIGGYMVCQYCGTTVTPRFEAHHIIYRSEKPFHEHLHDKENILIVCISCHNKLHKHKGLRNSIVEKRKLNELFGNDVLDKRTA